MRPRYLFYFFSFKNYFLTFRKKIKVQSLMKLKQYSSPNIETVKIFHCFIFNFIDKVEVFFWGLYSVPFFFLPPQRSLDHECYCYLSDHLLLLIYFNSFTFFINIFTLYHSAACAFSFNHEFWDTATLVEAASLLF